MKEDTNSLLSAVLATMIEGVLIVNSRLDIILYNNSATRIVKLPAIGAVPLIPEGVTNVSMSLNLPSKGFSPGYKLVDATRDPAIHEAFRRVLKERLVLDSRIEMAGIEARAYQLHISPLGADLAVGVFFDITELERLERVRREFFANLSH